MKLAVCAICRNERPYILEWISLQKALGFDEIFIYDNVSDDGTSELLISLHEHGIITRIHWPRQPNIPPQRAAYAHFIQGDALGYDYVLICDIDEFLVPDEGNVRKFIEAAEAADPNVSAIAIPWLIFGSSGQGSREPGWVTERFHGCEEGPDKSVKTLFRPERVYNMRTHICDLLFGNYLDNNFQIAQWRATPIYLKDPQPGKALVFHYFTKSREEWEQRRLMGRADRATIEHRTLELFDRYHNQAMENDRISRFLPAARNHHDDIQSRLTRAADQYNGYEATILSLDGSWLIIRIAEITPGAKIHVLVNGDLELTSSLSKTLADGSLAIVVNRQWLAKDIDELMLTPAGADTATRFTKSDFPTRKTAFANILRYMPSAEEMLFRRASSLTSSESGFKFFRKQKLPSFLKFPHYGEIFKLLLSADKGQILTTDDMELFSHRFGDEGRNALKRFQASDHFCSRLLPPLPADRT